MADQTKLPTLEELRRGVQDKERELSEMDLMPAPSACRARVLADYHAERSRLIRKLRLLQAQVRDAEEAGGASPAAEVSRF